MNLKVNGSAPTPEGGVPAFRKTPMMLIHEISRLMGERIRETGAENPISQKSGQLLMVELSRKDGRTQLDLVNATHLKAPTVSVSLQKLEHDGYVLRKPDEYDLRATRVYLTEKGRALDHQLRTHIIEEDDFAMASLTESEKETLVRLLSKIKENLISDNAQSGRKKEERF